MFKPRFQYTDRIIRNLTMIAEARAVVLNAPLIPKWEISLRREALLKSAHSSTAIEGNQLSAQQVSDLAAGRDIMVRRKDRQEVLNYIEALGKVPQFAQRTSFKPEDLLEIHKIVTKETLDNPADEGVFRSRPVFVVNRATGAVVFTPPPAENVPEMINGFLAWFNSNQTKQVDPVIQAGITHYEIVRIHPFIDGNGRTSRVMATLVLFKQGFDVKRFFALDDYYDQDRRSYYEALNKVDQQTLDLTGWLEYFTTGVAVSIKSVRDKVIGLSKGIKVLRQKGQIALTERQMKIVEYIINKGGVTNKDLRGMFNISNRAAVDEITKLLKIKVVKKAGKGRNLHYELV